MKDSTAVITYIDSNYQKNLEEDFLYTLRNVARYTGEIVIMDYGIDSSVRKRIVKKYGVRIVKYEKTAPVFSLRNRHLSDVISALPDHIMTILVIDGGDVWFQGGIEGLFEESKGKLACVEENIFYDNEWVQECISNLHGKIRERVKESMKDHRVKNSGMICGDREKICNLTEKIEKLISDCGFEFFGIDQLYFNYVLNFEYGRELICLSDIYNYVLVTNKGNYNYEDGKFIRKDGEEIVIVHNAGGNWRMISKNPELKEYYVENIREYY